MLKFLWLPLVGKVVLMIGCIKTLIYSMLLLSMGNSCANGSAVITSYLSKVSIYSKTHSEYIGIH